MSADLRHHDPLLGVRRLRPYGPGAFARCAVGNADNKPLERDLSHKLGLKVEIGVDGKGGAVTVHYQTLEQLDEIIVKPGT